MPGITVNNLKTFYGHMLGMSRFQSVGCMGNFSFMWRLYV